MSRLAAAALAACCAWSVSWTGALVDLPSALDRLAPELPDLHPPVWAERWLYNPRERTEAGLDALRDGRRDDGVEALDAALRQAPEDPLALYNAGTGRLFAEEQTDRAAALLERAADGAPPELAPRAYYNLGNARLAAGDAPGAVAAYRRSLRLDPSLRPAKRNLEIALARLDRHRPRTGEPREAPGGERAGETERSDETGGTEPPDRQRPPDQTPEDRSAGERQAGTEDRRESADEAEGQGAERTATPPEGPAGGLGSGAPGRHLLRFDEQADMTAEQASALLDAIDNLERAERRRAALERAAAKGASTEEDW